MENVKIENLKEIFGENFGKIKNIGKTIELLAEGWELCEEPLQLNDPSDEITYYDAEFDKIETI